jgi:hypothetical protein
MSLLSTPNSSRNSTTCFFHIHKLLWLIPSKVSVAFVTVK